MINPDADRTLFLDLETTGLDIDSCAVLEIAAVLTDVAAVTEFGSVDRVIAADPSTLDSMDQVVKDLHRNSGLTDLVMSDSAVQLDSAVEEIELLINQHLPSDGNLYINGSGVAEYDRPILRRVAPSLEGRFYYRSDDVSMVRNMLMKMGHDIGWTKGAFAPPEHRAMADVRQSIAQWRWFGHHVAVG